MKATEAGLLDFLHRSPQFVIPIYQRTYSWRKAECEQLWQDILRAGRSDNVAAHFVGSIVYIQQGIYHVASQAELLVIDGQQRLTTMMLLLEALAGSLGDKEPLNGFSAKKIRHYYLLNPLEEGERAFKLILTQTDKSSLLALMSRKPFPDNYSIRIAENFEFFEDRVTRLDGDLCDLCRGLQKLVIVDISLHQGQDNPQLIFESMNSTGRDLSQADLIRNYILMGLTPQQQEHLYKEYWRPMEVAFGQQAYVTHFDRFMRHYLTLKTDKIPKIRAVYEHFKGYSRSPEVQANGVEELVADVHAYAGYYCAMALDKEQDRSLSKAFRDLRALKVDVTFPLLLELYADYADEKLPLADLVEAVEIVEAYLFRRAACAIPTNSHNYTFAHFGRSLRKHDYIQSIRRHFSGMRSYRRFPGDAEFRRELIKRDLYNFPRSSYWLRRLENFERKEPVPVDEYTIEHIMPQNETLSSVWKKDLGEEWKRVHDTWLHTLGNLTLTGYNQEYSDRPFREKRDLKGGFRESPLRLNKGLRDLDTWNEETIRRRADRLADQALHVWRYPTEIDTIEDVQQPASNRLAQDPPDTFHHLAPHSPMHSVFQKLRRAVLDLNPCITEEVHKQYVAFRAETNIVDIIPQYRQLLLYLNMQYFELVDPRDITRDVTDVGHWGNGDVEIRVSEVGDLSYVMGLIRQSFEMQMGDAQECD